MSTESWNRSLETQAAAVAKIPGRAGALAVALKSAGIPAGDETDLDSVLERGIPLLLIDPEGWEDSCRTALEAFDTRRGPPPAVLFASVNSLVPYTAGPSFGFVSSDAPPQDLSFLAARALRARARFSAYWPVPLSSLPARELQRIATSLERNTGLEIRSDRANAFLHGVRQRMVARLIPSAREYADLVERNAAAEAELEVLAGLLSVGETHFWRYSGQFLALQTHFLQGLLRQEGRPRRLRIWSAGCATGEEVYSIAMACAEAVPQDWAVEIVGTDLHRPSVAAASEGVYGPRSLRNLPPALAQRYVEAVPGGGSRVRPDLKETVRVEALNLRGGGRDEWVRRNGPFDAVFCRNTLIYFSRSASDELLGVFEGALGPGGALFLGASEAVSLRREYLRGVRGPGCFYYVKEPGTAAEGPEPARPREPAKVRREKEVAALYEKGLRSLDEEDFLGAEESFRSILARVPGDARGHTGLGLLLANEGRETEAVQHLELAKRRGPDLPETHYLLGLVGERLGRECEALDHYGRALGLDADFFMARFNRAWILRRRGDRDAFAAELSGVCELLGSRPAAPPWVTGGLSVEALMAVAVEALAAEEGPG